MSFLLDPRIVRLTRLGFWLALIFACTMAVLPMPPHMPVDSLGDKFEHMLAFFTLSTLAMLGYGRAARWRIIERLAFLGAMIELVQSIPALHRDCDIKDWVADSIAILIGVVIAGWVIPKRQDS